MLKMPWLLQLVEKFSSVTLLCWKMLILQNWNISQEHVDSIQFFNGKQAGRLSRKPVLLVTCQPGLLWLPTHQATAHLASWYPNPSFTLGVGWLKGGKFETGGDTDPQVGFLAVVFLWKFYFLYKNMSSERTITTTSFHRREILFSRLIYQWGGSIVTLCFLLLVHDIVMNVLLGGIYPA